MKLSLITAFLLIIITPIAHGEPIKPQFVEGFMKPITPPVQKGYVTKDGKRYGNCRNHHHSPHSHCKEPRDIEADNKPKGDKK